MQSDAQSLAQCAKVLKKWEIWKVVLIDSEFLDANDWYGVTTLSHEIVIALFSNLRHCALALPASSK